MEGRYLVPFIFQVDEMSLVTQDRFFSSKTPAMCASRWQPDWSMILTGTRSSQQLCTFLMNRNQLIILLAGVVLFGVSELLRPWVYVDENTSVRRSAGLYSRLRIEDHGLKFFSQSFTLMAALCFLGLFAFDVATMR